MTTAERALEFVQDGQVVGLGTGRAATAFIHALAERVRAGLRVRGIATSQASADLAESLGITLGSLAEHASIDVTVDGADEIDPALNLIKGRGGALVREKVVAAAARRFVVVAGSEKVVTVLGMRGSLPVEVVPFALAFCRRRLAACVGPAEPRMQDGGLFVTDNKNYIIDCHTTRIDDPARLEQEIHSIPGVVGTGLFLALAHVALVQDGDTVRVLHRQV